MTQPDLTIITYRCTGGCPFPCDFTVRQANSNVREVVRPVCLLFPSMDNRINWKRIDDQKQKKITEE